MKKIFIKMNTILQRIQQIAVNEGIKITAFEKSIGASKGVLSRAINNGTDIQAKWLQNIVENYPRYSEAWLLTGQGPMLKEETPNQVKPEHYPASPDSDLYYKMYKEEKAENRELIEEIGALKQQVRTLECENRILRQDKSKLERVVEMIEGTKKSSFKVKHYTDEDEMEKEEASFLPMEKL